MYVIFLDKYVVLAIPDSANRMYVLPFHGNIRCCFTAKQIIFQPITIFVQTSLCQHYVYFSERTLCR
jgi:hypothetical protein